MRRVTAVLAVSCGLMCAGLAPSSASAQLLPGLPLPLPGLGGGGGLGGLLGGLPIPLPGLGGSGGSGSGSGSGAGGLTALFPNPPSCGFSIGWSGIGAGCQPPTAAQPGAAGFLGGLFPNPPSCSAGIGWL